MQSKLEIRALAINGAVEMTSIEVAYRDPDPDGFEQNPRLGFALPFIKSLIQKKYHILKTGDRFMDKTLLMELVIEEVFIFQDPVRPLTKQIQVNALIVG